MTEKQFQLWKKSMAFGKACGCHQLPDRSFKIKGIQFPFCARCTGIIIGELITGPILLLLGFRSIVFSLILLGLMGIDGTLQYFKIIMSTNPRRLITGIFGGIALISLTYMAILYIISLF